MFLKKQQPYKILYFHQLFPSLIYFIYVFFIPPSFNFQYCCNKSIIAWVQNKLYKPFLVSLRTDKGTETHATCTKIHGVIFVQPVCHKKNMDCCDIQATQALTVLYIWIKGYVAVALHFCTPHLLISIESRTHKYDLPPKLPTHLTHQWTIYRSKTTKFQYLLFQDITQEIA